MVKEITKQKLYLDVCTLSRPFDDQSMIRIRFETDAFCLIFQNVKNKKYDMIVLPVYLKEIDAIADLSEKSELITVLTKFGVKPSCNLQKVRERAEYLSSLKFGIADAAHLAFAEETSDVLITCDDRFLRKCKKTKVKLLTVSPVEFCLLENLI